MARKPRIFVPQNPTRCCGKNSYATKDEAQRIADEQMLLRNDLHLGIYACVCGCGGWHLTRTPRAQNETFTA